jgi:hypothetical protein
MMLPVAARVVVLALLLLPSISLYVSADLRQWAIAGSPAYSLTERFFWALGIGRILGALLLATLLLYWRRPASLATTITAVWMAGPPLTFLWKGIVALAASLGQSSWAGDPLSWLVPAVVFPAFVTLILLVPVSVRRAYAVS